jgi:hypothetical protein
MKEPLSRRDFLKMGGMTFLSAMAPDYVARLSPPENAYDRLESYGLANYITIYNQMRKTEAFFGSSVPLWESVTNPLKQAVDGAVSYDDAHIKELRDGWGDRRFHRVDDAIAYVGTQTIITSRVEDGTTEDEVRNFLYGAASSFPLIALAIPQKVTVWKDGGAVRPGSEVFLTTPRNTQNAPVTYLHEGTHAIDYTWPQYRLYMEQASFMRYVAQYLESVDKTAREWINSSDVLKYIDNHPLMGLINDRQNPEQNKNLLEQMDAIRRAYGFSVFPFDEYRTISSERVVAEWNTLVFSVGRKLKSLSDGERQSFLAKTSESTRKLFVSGIISQPVNGDAAVLPGLLTEIEHLLVGPIQKNGGGLPSAEKECVRHDVIKTGVELQKMRMQLYSTFSAKVSLWDIKRAFGQ